MSNFFKVYEQNQQDSFLYFLVKFALGINIKRWITPVASNLTCVVVYIRIDHQGKITRQIFSCTQLTKICNGFMKLEVCMFEKVAVLEWL